MRTCAFKAFPTPASLPHIWGCAGRLVRLSPPQPTAGSYIATTLCPPYATCPVGPQSKAFTTLLHPMLVKSKLASIVCGDYAESLDVVSEIAVPSSARLP